MRLARASRSHQLTLYDALVPKSNGAVEQVSSPPAAAAVADTELRRKLENASGRHLEHVAAMRAEFPPLRGRTRRCAAHQSRTPSRISMSC